MFIFAVPFVYYILSLLIGGIAGFATWNFSLLRDLVIFWTPPTSDTGVFWKALILLISVIGCLSAMYENNNYFISSPRDDLGVPKIDPDDYTISSTNQVIERKEPTTEPPKERNINIII